MQGDIFVGDKPGQKITLKKQKEWFANYKKAKDKQFFTICDNAKAIGFMGLSNISKENKSADLFIAIGEDDYRGKGIGKIAMQWLLDYGFKKLKLYKIRLGVFKDNIPAVRLYRSVGFIEEGDLKDEFFHQGSYYDFLLMAIFNEKNK